MFGSIIIPILLSILQLTIDGPNYVFDISSGIGKLLFVIFLPIFPILIITKDNLLQHASKTYKTLVNKLEEAKQSHSKFIHTDIGIEAFYQLLIQTILLLLARSETRTIFGMEKLFDENKSVYGISPDTLLVYSIGWSLFSCVRSHMKGISKKRLHSHMKANAIILIFALASIMQKMWCSIFYFTPCLGLYDILRHLQGETYPFKFYTISRIVKSLNGTAFMDEDLFQFSNATPIPWTEISRWNYTIPEEPSPPPLTIYTNFTIGEYFWFYISLMCLHILLTCISKKWMNPEVFKKMTFINIFIHAICNLSIPHPMEDWDEYGGTVVAHRRRMKLVLKEVHCTILLNFIINFVLLLPLTILGKIRLMHI